MAGGLSYGTRFDDEIRRGVAGGRLMSEIARSLRVSEGFVRKRVIALGLLGQVKNNLKAATAAGGRTRESWRSGSPFMGKACLREMDRIADARDEHSRTRAAIPTKLLRNLRGKSVKYSRNAIGALHSFGLTLNEIEEITSRHPAFIVDAIKRASACP